MKPKLIIVLAFVSVCWLLSSTIWEIKLDGTGNFTTIQEGINASSHADTVLVYPGTYFENISAHQKHDLHIVGSGADVTTIDGGENGHVVAISFSTASISNFTITNSGNDPGYSCGIFTSHSRVVIESNIIVNNCYGISASSTSNVIIYGNKIINNDGFYVINVSSSIAHISFNLVTVESWIGIYNNIWSSTTLLNNTIVGSNDSIGLLLVTSVPLSVRNNIISNFEYGILIMGEQQSVVSLVDIAYNDVWGNSILNYLEEYYIGTNFYSHPFHPQPGTGEIHEDPSFVDPFYGDYHLQVDSPCIDAGDPGSPLDPDGTIADMGALYFPQEVGIDQNIVNNFNVELSNFPNPFNPFTIISFNLPKDFERDIELEIYNIKGQKVKQLVRDQLPAGQQSVAWDGRDENYKQVSSGIYFARLKAGDVEVGRKMLLIK
ncbi:FlgD immunoglobulin-like domain containing protein [Candidatus Cloacimonadota bacterium]